VLVLDMMEILPPIGKYKYDTWRILPVKCYIDNFVHLRSCIRNVNNLFDSYTCKSFLNKLNLKPYSDSICSGKTGYSGIQNQIVQFLRLQLLAWISSILAP
jgi:hypothetical protein